MGHQSKWETVLLKKATSNFFYEDIIKIAEFEYLIFIKQLVPQQIVLLDSSITAAGKISNHSEHYSCMMEVPSISKKLFRTHVITCSAASIERSKRRRNKSGLQYKISTVAFKSNYECEGLLVDAPD